jgi:hypothetical protein
VDRRGKPHAGLAVKNIAPNDDPLRLRTGSGRRSPGKIFKKQEEFNNGRDTEADAQSNRS